MTNQEFSAEFDVLYNNVTSNQAPGINEYEKSVFLTKAQAQLIKEYFNERVDGVGGGFDGSQIRQYDFSQLIMTVKLTPTSADSLVDKRSVVYEFPKDYFLSVNEILSDADYQYNVIPISYAEYGRLMMKPYNYPVKRAVWRLFTGSKILSSSDTGEANIEPDYKVSLAEIIGKPTMINGKGMTIEQLESANINYVLRYVKKPRPIVLENLSNYGVGISIEGEYEESSCELPESMHPEILERAVTLAKVAWQGGTFTQAQGNNN